jgi:hypothetical protein
MTSQVRTLPYREGGLAANLGRLPGFGPELLAMKTSQTGEPAVICTPVMLAAARSWPGSQTDIPEAGQLGRVPALELQNVNANNDDCHSDLLPQSNTRGRCTRLRRLLPPSYFRFRYCSRRLVISLLPLRSLAIAVFLADSRSARVSSPLASKNSASSRG